MSRDAMERFRAMVVGVLRGAEGGDFEDLEWALEGEGKVVAIGEGRRGDLEGLAVRRARTGGRPLLIVEGRGRLEDALAKATQDFRAPFFGEDVVGLVRAGRLDLAVNNAHLLEGEGEIFWLLERIFEEGKSRGSVILTGDFARFARFARRGDLSGPLY